MGCKEVGQSWFLVYLFTISRDRERRRCLEVTERGVPAPFLGTHWEQRKQLSLTRLALRGFPSGSVVKNLPANAGDAGSILG